MQLLLCIPQHPVDRSSSSTSAPRSDSRSGARRGVPNSEKGNRSEECTAQQIRYKRIWGSTRRGPIARRGVRPPRSAPDENHDKEQMSCASVASEGGCKCHIGLIIC